jgi:hypothetical protein
MNTGTEERIAVGTGWVIEMKKGNVHMRGDGRRFYASSNGQSDGYTSTLVEDAVVYSTRAAARAQLHDQEIVRKVSVGTDGKAIEIIKGR